MATKKSEPRRCASCRTGALKSIQAEDEIVVGGAHFVGLLPGWRCKSCGEIFFDSSVVRSFELVVAQVLGRRGLRTGEVFRFMRKALGMTAVELAELLDGTPETVSRWETGKWTVDRRALAILSALVNDKINGQTTTLDSLRAASAPMRKLRGKVRVELPPNLADLCA